MVSGWVVGLLVLIAFLIGAGISMGSGVFIARMFTPKPTKKEIVEEEKKRERAVLEERAWSEGFNSVEAYVTYLKRMERGDEA